MNNYELASDEVILMESDIFRSDLDGMFHLVLTSKKMIYQSIPKKGLFKSKNEEIENYFITLDKVKTYNGKVQVHQKGEEVSIQTIENNFTISFDGVIEAMKFVTKITDAITGTTISDRGTEKVKKAFNKVDDVLGFDTRGTVKGVIETGITGTLLTGIGKRKKNKLKEK